MLNNEIVKPQPLLRTYIYNHTYIYNCTLIYVTTPVLSFYSMPEPSFRFQAHQTEVPASSCYLSCSYYVP